MARATPSPLSQMGLIPHIYHDESFSHGRPQRLRESEGAPEDRDCLLRGAREHSCARVLMTKLSNVSKPSRSNFLSLSLLLSRVDFRLNFMHRSRMRIHESSLWKRSFAVKKGVAKY